MSIRDEIINLIYEDEPIVGEGDTEKLADRILELKVEGWEPTTRLKWADDGSRQYPTLQEVIEGKARKV